MSETTRILKDLVASHFGQHLKAEDVWQRYLSLEAEDWVQLVLLDSRDHNPKSPLCVFVQPGLVLVPRNGDVNHIQSCVERPLSSW